MNENSNLFTQIKQNIDQYGLQVIMLDATPYLPSFAYSIGLFEKYLHPEIICFGLSNEIGHTIINDVADFIKEGGFIEIGKVYDDFFEEGSATFLKVDGRNTNDYFGTALNYYQTKSIPALELIWTDCNNNFPWNPDFDSNLHFRQPLLDRNADFKFREDKNVAVFTTRQWLEQNKPILRVVHNTDGYWEFLTNNQELDDIKLVSLAQIVNRDKTLNEIFDLEYGEGAHRAVIGGEWERFEPSKEN